MALTEINSLGLKDAEVKTADIAAANVTLAKVENVTDGQIIVGNGSNRPTAVAVSGDVTLANTGAVTIATGAVEHAMLANDSVDGDNIADDAVAAEHIADDAVGAAAIADNAIVNASVDASAAIAGSKISPDFGAQNIATTGSISGRHGRAPSNTQANAYTLVATDAGKVVKAANGVTVPESVFADGDILMIYNSTTGDITITQGSNFTLRNGGSADTGNRTLAQKGLATIVFVAANEAVIGGLGVS